MGREAESGRLLARNEDSRGRRVFVNSGAVCWKDAMSSCKNVDTKLLPMKVVMFGWFGASACALPYMTVHMKELGLTVEETAIVYTLLPITQFLSSPVAGFIADRLGKYRDVLLLSIGMTIILATALLYVPPVERSKHVTASFACNGENASDVQCHSPLESSNRSHLFCSAQCDGASRDIPWASLRPCLDLDPRPVCRALAAERGGPCSVACSSRAGKSGSSLTFYSFAALRIVYNIFSAVGFTLVNASALALTETDAQMGEYGRQRLWAILSMAIFSPLAGLLVDVMSVGSAMNYAPAYHTHNVLAFLTGIAVWYLDFEMEDAPSSYMETFKNLWRIIKKPSIFFLLIIVFWLGTMWGFLESYLFWFMQELDSPTYLLGLTVTVGSAVGLPFLYFARHIVTKIGYASVLSTAVFMYMIRCVGCSLLQDPWWIMPFECLEIFTYHLMWVAAATYATHLSPTGLLATIQGFIEGLHYGVGLGSGSLIGGALMSTWGSRTAFRAMGAASGIVAIVYVLLNCLWLRKITVQTRSRKASVKSFNSQKLGRKSSSISYNDTHGTNMIAIIQPSNNQEAVH